VDAVTAARIEEETSLARRNDQVGSNLNIAGTTRQALAAIARHGKRRGYGGYCIGSRTGGLAIRGYDAFTAHVKDTRKVTAR